MSTPVEIAVLDASGNVVTSANNVIVLTLQGGTVGAALSSTAATASSGIATLNNLSVNTAGTGYTILAQTSGLTSATSSIFDITIGSVAALQFVSGHSAGSSVADNDLFSPTLQVKAVDAGGNPVSGVTVDATVINPITFGASPLRRPPGPAAIAEYFGQNLPSISLVSATTNSSGIADFGAGKMRGVVQSFRLTFTARGTSASVTTDNISLSHGAASNASCSVPFSHVGLSHKISVAPTFTVLDIDNNVVDNAVVVLTPSSGSLLDASSSVTTDALGYVTAPHWTVGSSAQAYTLGISGATGNCSVTAAVPNHISLTGTIASSKNNGDAIESISATVVDASGNAIEDTTFTITVHGNPANNASGTVDGTSSHGTDSHGKATFADLVLDADAQSGMTLGFEVSGLSGVTATSNSFTVTVGSAASLTATTATSVSAFVGQTDADLSSTPTVRIKDHGDHNLVANQTVTWTIVGTGCPASNGPAFRANPATSTTDNSGRATIPTLDLGFTIITSNCAIRAAVGSLTVDFQLTVNPGF